MSPVILACARCGEVLTRPVCLVPESVRTLDAQDRSPTLPAGSIAQLAAAQTVPVTKGGVQIGEHEYSPAGAYSGNPADLVRAQVESTGHNDAGCCGSDGMDGPNRRCRCGAVLGTEWSDCWTQWEFRFWPDAVVARPTPRRAART